MCAKVISASLHFIFIIMFGALGTGNVAPSLRGDETRRVCKFCFCCPFTRDSILMNILDAYKSSFSQVYTLFLLGTGNANSRLQRDETRRICTFHFYSSFTRDDILLNAMLKSLREYSLSVYFIIDYIFITNCIFY